MFPNQENGRFHVHEDGTLSIDNIRRSDSGQYTCHALSKAGSIETSMTIDVRGIHSSFILICPYLLTYLLFTAAPVWLYTDYFTKIHDTFDCTYVS